MQLTLISIPPLIAAITALVLSIFVLSRNPKREINILLSFFLLTIFVLSFGEFMVRLAGKNIDEAFIWHQLVVLGGEFISAIFLHFALIFPKKTDFVKRNYYYIIPAIYIFRFAVYIPIFFISPAKEFAELTPYGYYSQLSLTRAVCGNLYYSNMLFMISIIGIGLFVILGFIYLGIKYFKTKINIEKNQIKLIMIGTIFFMGIGFLTDIILPSIGINILQLASVTFLISAVIISYAIVRYRLTSIELISEPIKSVPINYELEPGYTYIIPESEPKLGFQLFAKTTSEGANGICITLRNPNSIRDKYGLKNTPIIWITNQETNELSVKPSEIVTINEILTPFFEKSMNSVIILIDDKTITSGVRHEDHSKVLEISKQFFDTVVTSKSKFIISVSPSSINPIKRKSIIKTQTPLLEFTRLSAFVLEEICNNVVQFLIRNGYSSPEKINDHIFNLRKKDPFFNNISFRKSGNPISVNNKIKIKNVLKVQPLSKQILVDKIKFFISEFENIETAMDLKSIGLNSVGKYGLSKNEFKLHIGDTYLITETEPRKSFEIFSEFISKDYKGLCITKSNPKKISRKFSLFKKGVKTYWLTDISETKKDILPPKLEHILSTIEDFLSEEQDKKIVLLDGIEYLIFYRGDIFDAVLSFLRRLTDRTSETNALILIPLDPSILSKQRMSLLKRSGMEIYNPE